MLWKVTVSVARCLLIFNPKKPTVVGGASELPQPVCGAIMPLPPATPGT